MLESRESRALQRLLIQLDGLALECDGMSSALSSILAREGVEHRVCVGTVDVIGVGTIPLHHWVALPDGLICDIRARMWLGPSPAVPHGLFVPDERQQYTRRAERAVTAWPDWLFTAITDRPISDFTLIAEEGTLDEQQRAPNA